MHEESWGVDASVNAPCRSDEVPERIAGGGDAEGIAPARLKVETGLAHILAVLQSAEQQGRVFGVAVGIDVGGVAEAVLQLRNERTYRISGRKKQRQVDAGRKVNRAAGIGDVLDAEIDGLVRAVAPLRRYVDVRCPAVVAETGAYGRVTVEGIAVAEVCFCRVQQVLRNERDAELRLERIIGHQFIGLVVYRCPAVKVEQMGGLAVASRGVFVSGTVEFIGREYHVVDRSNFPWLERRIDHVARNRCPFHLLPIFHFLKRHRIAVTPVGGKRCKFAGG